MDAGKPKQGNYWPFPDDWEITELDKVAEIKEGSQATTSKLVEKGAVITEENSYPFIQSGDLKNTRDIYTKNRILKNKLPKRITIFPKGTVLLAAAWEGTAGRCGLLNTDAVTNAAIQGIRPKNNAVLLPEYLFYFFRRKAIQEQILQDLATHHVTYFSKEKTKRLLIPLPPLTVQRYLVKHLDDHLEDLQIACKKIDASIEKAQQIYILILNNIFLSLETNADIQKIRLGDVVDIDPPPGDVTKPQYAQAPLILPRNLAIAAIKSPISSLEAGNLLKQRQQKLYVRSYDPNIVLYCLLSPERRRIAQLKHEQWQSKSQQEYIACHPDILPLLVKQQRLDPRFLMWALIAEPFTRYAIKNANGSSGNFRISKTKVLEYLLPIPELFIQQKIINQLEDPWNTLNSIQERLQHSEMKLKTLEENIIQLAFQKGL